MHNPESAVIGLAVFGIVGFATCLALAGLAYRWEAVLASLGL